MCVVVCGSLVDVTVGLRLEGMRSIPVLICVSAGATQVP